MEAAFLCAVRAADEQTMQLWAQGLLRYFPFSLSEEALRPMYLQLLQCAREGRGPERDEERAAALIFKELGFFEPVEALVPASEVRRRRCTESQLFMALSTR